jgi:hypothetical protein
MADLKRLDFEEIDRMWIVTEFYSDGSSRPGKFFMASGHDNNPKLRQIDYRLNSNYPAYWVTNMPYNKPDEMHYSLEVLPKPAEASN